MELRERMIMLKYVKAENYLCFMALLEMVLIDVLETDVFDQYNLAELFGITLPINTPSHIKNVTYSDKPREYGCHIDEYKLNLFFRNTGIPLQTTYFRVNPYEDIYIDEYGNDEVRQGKYIIYTYSYGSLYKENQSIEFGHVSLLEDVISERKLRIYDPGPRNVGVKIVDRIAMYEAMRCINAGIYVINRNE